MSKKILVVKHPSGIKKTIEFNKYASLADVFTTASKQFNLNQRSYELKLGPETLNLNDTIEGSKIPETVILDIAPKATPESEGSQMEVLVRMGFSDEGYIFEHCSQVMYSDRTLWDVVKAMVPSHMAYSNEDVCLTFLGINYKGKKRLKMVKLADLCGRERQLFFMCTRNYLQKAYRRVDKVKKGDKKLPVKLQKSQLKLKSEHEHRANVEPTLGNPNPGVVELSDRRGRLYHEKYISKMSGDLSSERGFDSLRSIEGKLLVRIVFPNTAVMEGVFASDETIKDVANFVKNHLVEKARQFYFYTVKPRLIVGPDQRLGSMRSSPPGTLWYCGRFKSELFQKDILSSLLGRVFSYVSSDIPEESKFDLRAASSWYSWERNASPPQ